MNFRRTLFIISVIMLGFCLSMYFQSMDTIKSVNIDHTTNIHYVDERSHSLEEFNEKIPGMKLENIIGEVYEKNKLAGVKTRIMEIGSGNGRVIMELKKLFPEAEFYGVNKSKNHDFYRRESFATTAINFQIFTPAQLAGLELPFAIFQNLDFGQPIPYSDARFDVIYSQNTIEHIRYKFELFNEILRVLKMDGQCIITDLPVINLYKKSVLIDLQEAILEFRRKGIHIQNVEIDSSIIFKKTSQDGRFPMVPLRPIPANTDQVGVDQSPSELGYSFK